MATFKITYTDKNKSAPLGSFEGQWRDGDANEVKRVVNNLASLMGADGEPGSPGVPSSVGDIYMEVAVTGVTDMEIEHNLGKRPSVQVFDSAGNQVEAWFKHLDENNTRHLFNKAFTGTITLN